MEERLLLSLYNVSENGSASETEGASSGSLIEDTRDKSEAETSDESPSVDIPLLICTTKPGEAEAPNTAKSIDKIQKKYLSLRKTSRLWRYNPVPKDEPYPTEEVIFSDERLRWGSVTAARVRGKSHMYYGTNCDDWYETSISDREGIFCAAVSDGAGSCKFSRIGARLICEFVVDFLLRQVKEKFEKCPDFREMLESDGATLEKAKEYLTSTMVYTALQARNLLFTDAVWRKSRPEYSELKDYKDLSATLMIVLLIPLRKDFVAVSFQVGDGVIALIDRKAESCSEAITVMGDLDRGDFAGETQFITSLSAQELYMWSDRVKIWRGCFDTMFIMSDGVSEDYMPFTPELCRLYLDMLANNIFPDELKQYEHCEQDENIKLPSPLIFPNIKRPEIRVSLNYTWQILNKSGLSLDDLWKHREIILRVASQSTTEGTSGKRLAQWLENYVEISSSDDRTLVVVRRA